jgi:hypothetical protein
MNSISKYPLHEENSINRQDQDCDCQHPKGNKVIFQSSYSNFGPLNVVFTDAALIQTFNQPIASVTIDTACLNVTNTVIDFTGILNVTPVNTAANSTLIFTLFKTCNDRRIRQSVSTVNFFVVNNAGATNSFTLAFKFPFKNNECKDCCTYILELTSIFNADPGTVTYSINGTLSALTIVAC